MPIASAEPRPSSLKPQPACIFSHNFKGLRIHAAWSLIRALRDRRSHAFLDRTIVLTTLAGCVAELRSKVRWSRRQCSCRWGAIPSMAVACTCLRAGGQNMEGMRHRSRRMPSLHRLRARDRSINSKRILRGTLGHSQGTPRSTRGTHSRHAFRSCMQVTHSGRALRQRNDEDA